MFIGHEEFSDFWVLKALSANWRNLVRQLRGQGSESKVRTMVVIVPATEVIHSLKALLLSFQKVLFALLVLILSSNCLALSVLDQTGLKQTNKQTNPPFFPPRRRGEGTFLSKHSLSLFPSGFEG